ncbi:carbohydrate porin [Chitinimonas naiadis]
MKLTLKQCAAAVGLACLAAPAFADNNLEFHGYMRAAVGTNTKGGTMVCYGLPGADTKWRLGNECDYVIEPNLIYTAAKTDEYGTWKVQFMPSVYRGYGSQEFGNTVYDKDGKPIGTTHGTDELLARYNQVYIYGEKISQLNNGTVWGGRRFYDRVQLGINDQFLENHDSEGAGIEDVDFGVAKLSYAFLMNPRAGNDVNGTEIANDTGYEHAFRVTGIKTLPDSTLDIYFGYHDNTASKDQISGTDYTSGDGTKRIGFYHRTGGTLGGATFLGTKFESGKDFRQWRAVVQQTGLIDKTAWDVIAEYRRKTVTGKDEDWYSIGGRTDTHIAGPFRFLAELGHDIIKPEGGETRNMTKLTLMGAISAGKDAWSRPTFRVFYTYAKWNEAARKVLSDNWVNGDRLARVFGNKHNGSTIGAQVEAWW